MPQYLIADAGRSTDPQTLTRRRRLAEVLLQQGMDASPVGHWTQGAARIARALLGGLMANRAAAEEKAARESAGARLRAALAGVKDMSPQLMHHRLNAEMPHRRQGRGAAGPTRYRDVALRPVAAALFQRQLEPE